MHGVASPSPTEEDEHACNQKFSFHGCHWQLPARPDSQLLGTM